MAQVINPLSSGDREADVGQQGDQLLGVWEQANYCCESCGAKFQREAALSTLVCSRRLLAETNTAQRYPDLRVDCMGCIAKASGVSNVEFFHMMIGSAASAVE